MQMSLFVLRKFFLALVFCFCAATISLASPLLAQDVQPETGGIILLSQNENDAGRGDCFREGMGKPDMRPEGNCPGPGMHRGRRGPGGGMGHGMRHGMRHGGKGGVAQCPQPRSTAKAPEEIYKQTNPLEKTADNIEMGRLLFQLDAQPTCTMCHGSNGNGSGMMGEAWFRRRAILPVEKL